jgi:hypothetical protein
MPETDLQDFINNPGEGFTTEVKRWIDLDSIKGKVHVIKTLIALRNNNGGRFLIGFDDTTMQPVSENRPDDIRDAYHPDKIQQIVTKHISDPFLVEVTFPSRDGQEYPAITVPAGVAVPVVVKGDVLEPSTNKNLLQDGTLLVRTIRTGQISSATPNHEDLKRLIRICVDNTYGDFAQVLSRFLSHRELGVLRELVTEIAPAVVPITSDDVLEFGFQRFQTEIAERKLLSLPRGTWEVAVKLLPPIGGFVADRKFLDLLNNHNPRLTGWPMWVDSRGFTEKADHPYHFEGGWEALIDSLNGWNNHFDFMRIEPSGRFYLLRVLEDDVHQDRITPGTVFDFILPIWRVADVIATVLEFARGLGAKDDAHLVFTFRWRGLQGRQLTSWANSRFPFFGLINKATIRQDQVITHGELQVDAAENRVVTLTHELLQPLYAAFDGNSLDLATVQAEVSDLMKRRH